MTDRSLHSLSSDIDTHLTMGVSNFLRDLFETSFAVAGATGRSLVLIDEFGIGTNEVRSLFPYSIIIRYSIDRWYIFISFVDNHMVKS